MHCATGDLARVAAVAAPGHTVCSCYVVCAEQVSGAAQIVLTNRALIASRRRQQQLLPPSQQRLPFGPLHRPLSRRPFASLLSAGEHRLHGLQQLQRGCVP